MFTGEGKTVTLAMLAILLGIKYKEVDLITSSEVLAKRDVKLLRGIYGIFDLSCGCNCESENEEYRYVY
jgi:preprotein translocase subunit SecA